MSQKYNNLKLKVLHVNEDECKFMIQGEDTFMEESEKQILKIIGVHLAQKDKRSTFTINTNFFRFLLRDLQKFTERESKDAVFKIDAGMFKKQIKTMLLKNKQAFGE